MLFSVAMRNYYIIIGIQFSLKLRRTLVACLFDKCVNLSMKSITETNSGKLISLVSADLFTVERGLAFFPIMISSPILNLIGCYFLSYMTSLKIIGIVLGFWAGTMVLQ